MRMEDVNERIDILDQIWYEIPQEDVAKGNLIGYNDFEDKHIITVQGCPSEEVNFQIVGVQEEIEKEVAVEK